MNIDWQRLAYALKFYQERGYSYVEVPWIVSSLATNSTLPPDGKVCKVDGYGELVGSAEQGFVELALQRKLTTGAFVALTPCFRGHEIDELHQLHFMKIELCVLSSDNHEAKVRSDAYDLFKTLGVNATTVITSDGTDLEVQGIEVGSYGVRKFKDICWTYGTGLAEPRFSIAKLRSLR